MDFGGPIFVLAIIAMSTIGWIVTTAIRARHGYPVTDEWGDNPVKQERLADERTQALAEENAQLKQAVGRLEERLKVLERIATDPAHALAGEIEQLR